MGPTLCVMAKRALDAAGNSASVVAFSRFGDTASRRYLQSHGVEIGVGDVMRAEDLRQLPDAPNVIYLVGLKFGTQSNPGRTWAVNTLCPAAVCQRFPEARIVALSTGNVYPNTPVRGLGPDESHPLTPLGEYPNAAVARERIFDYFSIENGTRIAKMRLNYAVELRYGVLVDLAVKIVNGVPIDLANGYLNAIWQPDANSMILRALDLVETPASAWNLSSAEAFRVRDLAEQLGRRLGREPMFTGSESDTALLTRARKLYDALGSPDVAIPEVIEWVADWVSSGGVLWDKPTHFETRDGRY